MGGGGGEGEKDWPVWGGAGGGGRARRGGRRVIDTVKSVFVFFMLNNQFKMLSK